MLVSAAASLARRGKRPGRFTVWHSEYAAARRGDGRGARRQDANTCAAVVGTEVGEEWADEALDADAGAAGGGDWDAAADFV